MPARDDHLERLVVDRTRQDAGHVEGEGEDITQFRGGNSFQKFGVIEPYKGDSKAEGRAAVTGKDADRFNFKAPTLRNVEMTYPYFHDGAANTLPEAVDTMARIQLGKKFTPEENAKVVAFLKTLTGDQPNFKLPILPPSADATPRPAPFDKK